ncbi:MAG: GH25 family lysozyme [Eubacteriales bacterium]|nr:GH25 family lysozyme [Eubacteriales bacterium]MDD4475953.1 GH25 family lysozyme [Eubacteriales bacterium]
MKTAIGKGIDVSRWQGDVDWKKVAATGVDYAMIKATQGELLSSRDGKMITDSKFASNINGAHNAGLRCGVYHYACFTSGSAALSEYTYFFNTIKPHKDKITMYAALDFEDSVFQDATRKKANTDLVLLFKARAKTNGYVPALYTNRNFLTYYLEKDRLGDLAIWQAHYYTPRKNSPVPEDSANLVMWQWSEQGKVNGISTDVDLNEIFALPYIDTGGTGTPGTGGKVCIEKAKIDSVIKKTEQLLADLKKLL